jgi:2-oxoglutarate dehydrogenase complex dehydrogenase (E1) component-like enzyme
MADQTEDPNVFETANAGFAQAIYEDYLRDPTQVAPEWRRLFESGRIGEAPPPRAAVPPPSGNGSGNGASPAAAVLGRAGAVPL